MNELHKRMLTILSDLRPIAVSVVDAFDFPDASLKSSIGSYDGQVCFHSLTHSFMHSLREL